MFGVGIIFSRAARHDGHTSSGRRGVVDVDAWIMDARRVNYAIHEKRWVSAGRLLRQWEPASGHHRRSPFPVGEHLLHIRHDKTDEVFVRRVMTSYQNP